MYVCKYMCVCMYIRTYVCVETLYLRTLSVKKSRRLAEYFVMPANEASGMGGSSYGRIAL